MEYNNKYCNICKKEFSLLGSHYLKIDDAKHKEVLEQQRIIAQKALLEGFGEAQDIEDFIFGTKLLRKFWQEKYTIEEIKKIRKKFKYKKKYFKCEICNKFYLRRQSIGICSECLLNERKVKIKCLECKEIFSGWIEQKFCSLGCKTINYNKNRIITKEQKEKLSNNLKNQYKNGRLQLGGYTKWYSINSPRGLIRIQGSFELIFCKWMNEQKINWNKNLERFKYINLEDKISLYLPDFWIDDLKCFIEVKGWWDKKSIIKKKQFKFRIMYIDKNCIDSILKKEFEKENIVNLIENENNYYKLC